MRPMRRSSIFVGAVVAALSIFPALARAGDTTTAEALFTEGVNALQAKDWAKACSSFLGSERAEPAAGTELNLGYCNENLEKLATAWGWYKSAIGTALHQAPPQTERAEKAKKEADRLWPKLHFAVVTVKGGPYEGLTVVRDGESVPAEALGNPLPIDSGKHTFEVGAKGKKAWKREIEIAKGSGKDPVDLGPLEDAPVEATPPGRDRGGNTTIVVADPGAKQRSWGLVVGGAGILALLAGGALQGLALIVNGDAKSINNDRTRDPNTQCTDPANDAKTPAGANAPCSELNRTYNDKKDAAKGDQTAAIIVGATGAVMLGVGVALVLTAPSKPTTGRTTIVPLIGAGQAGLGVLGSF